jgi:hypothetical protein
MPYGNPGAYLRRPLDEEMEQEQPRGLGQVMGAMRPMTQQPGPSLPSGPARLSPQGPGAPLAPQGGGGLLERMSSLRPQGPPQGASPIMQMVGNARERLGQPGGALGGSPFAPRSPAPAMPMPMNPPQARPAMPMRPMDAGPMGGGGFPMRPQGPSLPGAATDLGGMSPAPGMMGMGGMGKAPGSGDFGSIAPPPSPGPSLPTGPAVTPSTPLNPPTAFEPKAGGSDLGFLSSPAPMTQAPPSMAPPTGPARLTPTQTGAGALTAPQDSGTLQRILQALQARMGARGGGAGGLEGVLGRMQGR